MPASHHLRLRLFSLLAACALALSACAPATPVPTATPLPTAIPPSATPPAPAAATSLPAAATAVPATSVSLSPSDVTFDANGNLYISQCFSPDILKVDAFGLLTVYASPIITPSLPSFPDNWVLFCAPALAFDRDGNLFVADINNHQIRQIDRNGLINTVVGGGPPGLVGSFGGDGGPARSARLSLPSDIVFDVAGNLYLADCGNNRIRKVDSQGVISTVAGTGEAGFSGDGGPATNARLDNGQTERYRCFTTIAVDAAGNLYIADVGNNRIRKVDNQGIMTTVAGTGEEGFAGDGGLATAAQINAPAGLAVGPDGSLYVSTDPTTFVRDNRVRKIDPNGIITTVVGTGEVGFSGDGGPATAATLRFPWGLAFDSDGNLNIVDNGRIRRVDQNGIITTIAGGAF